MKTIILTADCGGRTPLRTKNTAIPLLSVRGKPAIEYTVNRISLLKEVDEVFVVTSSRFFAQFKLWQENFFYPLPLRLIDNGSSNRQDRGGAVEDIALAVEKGKIDDDVLIIEADKLFSFCLREFVRLAKDRQPRVSIGTYDLNGRLRPDKLTLVNVDSARRVTELYEKRNNLNGRKLIAAGVYFFPKEKMPLVKGYIKEESHPDKLSAYLQWLCQREPVYAYEVKGTWFDMGSIDDYAQAVFNF